MQAFPRAGADFVAQKLPGCFAAATLPPNGPDAIERLAVLRHRPPKLQGQFSSWLKETLLQASGNHILIQLVQLRPLVAKSLQLCEVRTMAEQGHAATFALTLLAWFAEKRPQAQIVALQVGGLGNGARSLALLALAPCHAAATVAERRD